MCVNSASVPPVSLKLVTVYDCIELLTKWTTLSDDPCPITGYTINISGSTEAVAADQTTYSHPINDSDCGTTVDIHVSTINIFGTSSITSSSILIACTRKGIEGVVNANMYIKNYIKELETYFHKYTCTI